MLVCLYRIEAGAWFYKHLPWLKTIMHPAVVGAIPGLEALDVAWDAQADLESAMLQRTNLVLSSYDFKKYFDSFHNGFTKNMLLHCGMDPGLVQLTCHLYEDAWRTMKSGKSLSEPFQTANGFAQGVFYHSSLRCSLSPGSSKSSTYYIPLSPKVHTSMTETSESLLLRFWKPMHVSRF